MGQILTPFHEQCEYDPETGCINFVGFEQGFGYGGITRNNRTTVAHKYAWETYVGPVPEGLELDHLCRNRRCVNPDHLEPVTRATNVQRGDLAKLDWDAVHYIRDHADSESQTALAKRFGVTRPCIANVIHGRTWREEEPSALVGG